MRSVQQLADQIRAGADIDLYRGIRSLDEGALVRPEIHAIFMQVAAVIRDRFPQRVKEPLRHAYDAEIIAMEFCDDPATTRDDVLLVLAQTA